MQKLEFGKEARLSLNLGGIRTVTRGGKDSGKREGKESEKVTGKGKGVK